VLMGVTGAGKTTLLDVLAGRKTGGVIEGDIRVGGYPKVQDTFARISGYCEQTDVHSPQLTIWELFCIQLGCVCQQKLTQIQDM
jgi:ABC-type multidrug transport system ATPase subunit